MTIDKAIKAFPGTAASDWRIVGEAAVHSSVTPSEDCRFLGPAIIRSGTFSGGSYYDGEFHGGNFDGGTYHGGEFRGGNFDDGTFHGGEFRGGTFGDGTFYGGTFRGGMYCDGTFYGGTFYDGNFDGGTFYNGTFYNGAYYGGTYYDGEYLTGHYYGGEFTDTPLQIVGELRWPIVVQGDGRIAVGCICHSLDEWQIHGKRICRENSESWRRARKVLRRFIAERLERS